MLGCRAVESQPESCTHDTDPEVTAKAETKDLSVNAKAQDMPYGAPGDERQRTWNRVPTLIKKYLV